MQKQRKIDINISRKYKRDRMKKYSSVNMKENM